jgi:predicted dehydrogenase
MHKLFDDKSIDAVSNGLGDRWHALSTIWACQAGKDVYVEKPVSHNIWEGRKIVEAAARYGRVVQAGTQARSENGVRQALELVHSGKLGKIHTVRCPIFRPRERIARTVESAIPAGVHYDLWLGPAPWRPFRLSRFHYNWHWFWDTGNGETGNNGPHYADVARWGLQKYEHPRRVFSSGGLDGFDTDQETPNTQLSVLEYADGVRLQLDVRGLYTNTEDGMGMGVIFYGSEGWLRTDLTEWASYFGRKNEPGPRGRAPETVPPPHPHFVNFIECVRSRKTENLNAAILEGHLSTSLCHLGNIAYRTGRTLRFDSAPETFPGDAEANALLSRQYRYPFVVPEKV